MQVAVGGGPCGATARQRIPLCQRQWLPAVVILLVLGLSGTQLQLGIQPEPALKGFHMGPTTESIMEASLAVESANESWSSGAIPRTRAVMGAASKGSSVPGPSGPLVAANAAVGGANSLRMLDLDDDDTEAEVSKLHLVGRAKALGEDCMPLAPLHDSIVCAAHTTMKNAEAFFPCLQADGSKRRVQSTRVCVVTEDAQAQVRLQFGWLSRAPAASRLSMSINNGAVSIPWQAAHHSTLFRVPRALSDKDGNVLTEGMQLLFPPSKVAGDGETVAARERPRCAWCLPYAHAATPGAPFVQVPGVNSLDPGPGPRNRYQRLLVLKTRYKAVSHFMFEILPQAELATQFVLDNPDVMIHVRGGLSTMFLAALWGSLGVHRSRFVQPVDGAISLYANELFFVRNDPFWALPPYPDFAPTLGPLMSEIGRGGLPEDAPCNVVLYLGKLDESLAGTGRLSMRRKCLPRSGELCGLTWSWLSCWTHPTESGEGSRDWHIGHRWSWAPMVVPYRTLCSCDSLGSTASPGGRTTAP